MYTLRTPHTTVHIYPPKLTIGRAMRDFVIPDVTISRQHAEIIWEPTGDYPRLVLKDQSRFGTTKLNGEEVPRDTITGERRVTLKPLDVLVFGACQDEFTVVADRMYFCLDKRTSEIQAFAEKTGHQIICGFDPAATAFISTSDNLSADSISPACLTAVVYGVPVISLEYIRQYAGRKSGSTDSILPLDRFRIVDADSREKFLADFQLIYANYSAFDEVFRLAGASDSGKRLMYIGYSKFQVPRPKNLDTVIYALSEQDLIGLILTRSVIPEDFRVEFEPVYVPEAAAQADTGATGVFTPDFSCSGWIEPLNSSKEGESRCKVVPLRMDEIGMNAPALRGANLKRAQEELNIEFTTWRSNKTTGNQKEVKACFDDFFGGPQKRPRSRL